MMTEKQQVGMSKFLSLVLRHKPEIIGITIDENGWVDVADLINKLNLHGKSINKEKLDFIVENNSKKRFSFNEDKSKIRANQGHSIKVELGYESKKPPKILYHGTGEKYLNDIENSGLIKKKRHHVHLSSDKETATKVGQRHGKPVLFEVFSGIMYQDGFQFYLSENGVWLTDAVPVKYLKRIME